MADEPLLSGTKLAQQIALWGDRIRDMSATGLRYAQNIYDRQRYEMLQNLALEMLAVATGRSLADLEPLRGTIFSRMTPLVVGAAAIVDEDGRILLLRRADNRLWAMPGGYMEVGETPAEAVAREVLEETGVRCEITALVGVYDSRLRGGGSPQHLYKLQFLGRPLNRGQEEPISHAVETLETGWFAEDDVPADLYSDHFQRIRDAYRVWRGAYRAHFD